MFTCITIGDRSRILTRDQRNPGAFRSFVMACPVVYERQVLRLGPVNQRMLATVQWKAKRERQAGRAGPGPRWTRLRESKSAVSDYIVSPRFGRLGTDARERTHVLTSCRSKSPKNLRGFSSSADLSDQISGATLRLGNLAILNWHFKNLP